MDSKLSGMPLSTTQAFEAPPSKVASGIRAPLTNDSDFEFEYEYSSSLNCSSNYDNSESEEGFLSGEDGYGEFRPFVSTPDDNFEESSDLGEYDDSRSYLTDQDDEGIVGDNFQVGKNGDFIKPFVALTDRVALRVPMEMENEYVSDVNVEGPQVDGGVAMVSKQSMPIALVSGDSDDGSVHSEVMEDEGCSSDVGIPGALVLERVNNAPKVKFFDVEEDEGIDSQSENMSEKEVVEDLVSVGDEKGVLSSEDKEELFVVKDIVHDFKSAEVVEDKEVLAVPEGVKSDSLVGSQEKFMLKEMVDRDVLCSDEKIQGLKDDIGVMESVDLEKNTEHTDHANGIGEELEGSKLIGTEPSNNHVEEIGSPCGSLELNLQEMESEAATKLGESISLRTLHGARNYEGEDNYIHVDGTVILVQNSDKEELESRNEQKTDWMIESDDHIAASKNDSVDSSSRQNEMQNIYHVETSKEPAYCAETPKEPALQDSIQSIVDYSPDIMQSHVITGELLNERNVPKPVLLDFNLGSITTDEAEDDPNKLVDKEIDSFMYNDAEGLTFKESDAEEQEMEQFSQSLASASDSAEEISEDHLDGQIITDSDEEVERDDEYQSEEVFDSTAFAALLKSAMGTGSEGGRVTLKTADGNRTYTLERPAGLGSTYRPMRPSVQPDDSSVFPPAETDDLSEKDKKKLQKLQEIRVNYLRLLHRLNQSLEDPRAAQVLYRLHLAAGRPSAQAFSLDSAKKAAMELEAESNDHLSFCLNILVIGKTGVGKSATINSIFGEERATVDAFEPTTTHVNEINGIVNGVKIQVLDTPGLRSSLVEQSLNHKILSLIKKAMRNFSPDVVLYVDRLDVQTRDLNDLPLLKLVTKYLGSSIWRNAIITLTHAGSTPPDGPYGKPLSYEAFVAQRSRVVQQLINHSASDVHMITPGHISPVSLVENDLLRKNEIGQILLPNGENWRSQLMLLCYSTKVLSEITSVLKTEDTADHIKLFGYRIRSPPLLYFLTSLLQTNVHPKLSTEQGGEDGDSDIELTYSSESGQEDEEEYDQLPPFKPLRKSQIAKLGKDQQKAYFEEYDYRARLLQKKQWREEVRRIREMKKAKGRRTDYSYTEEEGNQETESPSTVAVPLPDVILPPSFDGDNPAYRYRFLEPSSQLLTRPVLVSHGWDHDCGYDGVSIEDTLAIGNRFPAVIAVQLTKDKKEFNIHLNSSVSAKHGENGSTMAGLDIQTVGKQLAYILKSELKVRNCKINKTAAGLSVTFLGKNVVTGLKVEDQIAIGKQLALLNAGFTCSQGNAAYGANLDVRLREKDYPIGQDQSTLSLSAMRWKGDTVWGCNLLSEFSVGRNSKINFRAGLNNKMSGQISIRTSSSDQLLIATLALFPIAKAIYRKMFVHSCEHITEDGMQI